MSSLPDLSYQILTPAMVDRPNLVYEPNPVDRPNLVKSKSKHIFYDEELNKYDNCIIKVLDKNKNKIVKYFLIFIAILYVVIILYTIITY